MGRKLYAPLLGILKIWGITLPWQGSRLPNTASVGLHESMGFHPIGIYRNIGFKLRRLARRRLVAEGAPAV